MRVARSRPLRQALSEGRGSYTHPLGFSLSNLGDWTHLGVLCEVSKESGRNVYELETHGSGGFYILQPSSLVPAVLERGRHIWGSISVWLFREYSIDLRTLFGG